MYDPSGFDMDARTTVLDLNSVVNQLLEFQWFRDIISQSSYTATLPDGSTQSWKNTNTFLDPTSDYYNENVIGVKTGSLSDDYNLVVLYRKYGKEFLICSLGSQSDSSRYDDVSNILRTIDESDYMSNQNIEKIIKLLRCAFKQAVRWEIVPKNPFDNVVLPKTEYKKRDIWTAEIIRKALDSCTESKLYIAMNLAFACSMRIGEILGLTWSNVHIEDEDIATDDAYVYIDKELVRASKRAIEMIGKRDIYHIFPPLFANTSTRVILKKPKTNSSIRKVWLPKTVAYILREWKASQNELKELLGDEYQDYDLVVAMPNGRPCEERIIAGEFQKLRESAGLPKVVFHSLRHSSTTYKLKLNHGDLKATQGDTGHAQVDMITQVYAHILDEDRKVNAQKFEDAFYASANPDLRTVRPPEPPKPKEPERPAATPFPDLAGLAAQLQKSPELVSTLAALLSAVPSEKSF